MVLKKKSSLITPYSIFVTHHLKYPNFLNPTRLTLFSASHHSNISIFVGLIPDPLPKHLTRVYPLSPHKSSFFFFFHHSPPIPRHIVLSSSPPLHSLPLTESKQHQSPPHRIQTTPIFSKGNPPSADLHRHLACKITSNGQQRCQSPLS